KMTPKTSAVTVRLIKIPQSVRGPPCRERVIFGEKTPRHGSTHVTRATAHGRVLLAEGLAGRPHDRGPASGRRLRRAEQYVDGPAKSSSPSAPSTLQEGGICRVVLTSPCACGQTPGACLPRARRVKSGLRRSVRFLCLRHLLPRPSLVLRSL